MRVLSLLVAVVVTSACNNHVYPPTLPAQMTPDQRLDVWRHWHSRGQGIEQTTSCSGRGGCSTTTTAILELEGGVQVRHPEDLQPLIPEGSKSAAALKKIDSAKSSRTNYTLTALAGVLIGSFSFVQSYRTENDNWFYYGGGAGLLVTLVGGLGVYMRNADILDASIEVYDNYDAALAQRLQVCVSGLAVVPCEQSTPGSTPTQGDRDPILDSLPQR